MHGWIENLHGLHSHLQLYPFQIGQNALDLAEVGKYKEASKLIQSAVSVSHNSAQ
jgi:hypothetical protein